MELHEDSKPQNFDYDSEREDSMDMEGDLYSSCFEDDVPTEDEVSRTYEDNLGDAKEKQIKIIVGSDDEAKCSVCKSPSVVPNTFLNQLLCWSQQRWKNNTELMERLQKFEKCVVRLRQKHLQEKRQKKERRLDKDLKHMENYRLLANLKRSKEKNTAIQKDLDEMEFYIAVTKDELKEKKKLINAGRAYIQQHFKLINKATYDLSKTNDSMQSSHLFSQKLHQVRSEPNFKPGDNEEKNFAVVQPEDPN